MRLQRRQRPAGAGKATTARHGGWLGPPALPRCKALPEAGLFIICFGRRYAVGAAARAMDAEVAVFQVRERAAEIAAAPVGFLGDFGCDFLGQLRIIGKNDHARAFVPERQTAIIIRGGRFAGLDVYGAGDCIDYAILSSAGGYKDGGAGCIEDVGAGFTIGLHRVAPRAAHRETALLMVE